MNVSLFITCFNDTLFPQAGRATVELLERPGHTVDFPEGQTCCGQMHYNCLMHRCVVPCDPCIRCQLLSTIVLVVLINMQEIAKDYFRQAYQHYRGGA